jgi:hypothetical protein
MMKRPGTLMMDRVARIEVVEGWLESISGAGVVGLLVLVIVGRISGSGSGVISRKYDGQWN